jgi:hypothetical protein
MLTRIHFFKAIFTPVSVLLCLSFAGTTGVSAQQAEELTECEQMLRSPPFVDVLTRNERKDFLELRGRNSGRALLGLECSVDELTVFFEDAGWEFLRYKEHSLRGPSRDDGGLEYYNDSAVSFCLKRPTLFGVFDFRCRLYASVFFHEGRIVYIQANGMSK